MITVFFDKKIIPKFKNSKLFTKKMGAWVISFQDCFFMTQSVVDLKKVLKG